MSGFLRQLETGLKTCRVQGSRLLLAVSGGPDSVAMLRGLLHFRDPFRLRLTVAHLNHELRGDESQADAEWLQTLAQNLDVPCVIESRNIAQIAKQQGQGLEETARQVRYAFLERTATCHGCSDVAVAHTADDQAETILYHVIRGTGMAGLCGILRVRPLGRGICLVRPLLGITRAEIETYLAELGQDFRRDASNRDDTFARNRLRNTLLPMLEEHYNPQVGEALRRLGQQAAEVQQTLEHLAARLLAQAVVDANETICRLNCRLLADQPRHLIRECFTLLWSDLHWPQKRMGFADWDRLAELVLHGGTATLPANIEARRRGTLLILRRR